MKLAPALLLLIALFANLNSSPCPPSLSVWLRVLLDSSPTQPPELVKLVPTPTVLSAQLTRISVHLAPLSPLTT